MNAEEQIKLILIREKLTMTELAERVTDKFQRKETVQNLSNKLKRGSLRYDEAIEIASALGYKVDWIKDAKP